MHDLDPDLLDSLRSVHVNRRAFLKAAATTAAGAAGAAIASGGLPASPQTSSAAPLPPAALLPADAGKAATGEVDALLRLVGSTAPADSDRATAARDGGAGSAKRAPSPSAR